MPFSANNLDQVQTHLASHPYLSEGGLPGAQDAQMYFDLGKLPEKAKYPNTHFWYLFINSFSNDVMKKWIEKSPNQKKAQTKPAETKKPADDDDDLFGDDSTPAESKPKPKAQPKKKKEKPAAKSIVVFDVKIYDPEETNLDDLAKKILAIQIDGLIWNNEPKKLDVAFGVQKLQLGCVIEDAKVLTDDIFNPIEDWEEVQSVDMVSMQKL